MLRTVRNLVAAASVLCTLAAGSSIGWAEGPSLPPMPGLGDFVTPQGTVDLEALMKTGVSGSVDLSGYRVAIDPRHGTLGVSPGRSDASRAEGDENWWDGFGSPGVPDQVNALAVYNGALIVGGWFTEVGGIPASRIARWDGTNWSTLGSGVNDGVRSLYVHDGKLIAGGWFTQAGGVDACRMAQWDGTSWAALGAGFNGIARALVTYDGDLIAGGDFTESGGIQMNRIARWDGTSWNAFGAGADGDVNALVVLGTDLVAAGGFTEIDGTPTNRGPARWNGSTWSAVGSWIWEGVSCAAVWQDHLYAASWGVIARLDDNDWVPVPGYPAYGGPDRMCIYDNKLIACGGENFWGPAAWDGTSWTPFGVGARGGPREALAEFDGKLYVGGWFFQAGNTHVVNIACWDGTAWAGLGSSPGLGVGGLVRALAVYQGDVIVGGHFGVAGDVPVNSIARWDGSGWHPLGDGVTGWENTVCCLLVHDGALFVGGAFDWAGGVLTPGLARWDGSTWSTIGGYARVEAMVEFGGDLVVGGDFTSIGGVEANRVARWDGDHWHPIGSGIGDCTVRCLTVHGPDLIAGGCFMEANGAPGNGVARWNGATWSPLGAGLGDGVNALAIYNGAIVAGGWFNQSNGANGVAQWNGNAWVPVGGSSGGGVRVLSVIQGDLYAAGDFNWIGGGPATRISRYDGYTWAGLGSGIGYGRAHALVGELEPADAHLYVGGEFTQVGDGLSSACMARWRLIEATGGPDRWAMKGRDMQHTGRADYSVPESRLDSSFFDIFLWQKPSPGSPGDGALSSTSMVFFDRVGPQHQDIVAAGYHWPKGVQAMDRHTGRLLWNGLPAGGESIGARTPAFSNDGLTLYVTNDATEGAEWPGGHPLMGFSSLDGPGAYRHNGADSSPGELEMDSPTVAPDGRIFLHGWIQRPRAASDNGVMLTRTWEAATHADCGRSDPAIHQRDDGTLLVYVGDRAGVMRSYDGNTGAELWTATMPGTIDAAGTIDPVRGHVYQPLGDPNIYIAGYDAYGQPLWASPGVILLHAYQPGVNDPERAQSAGCLSWDGATYYFQTANGSATGKLYAVNTADGSLKWTFGTRSLQQDEYAASPIVTRNGVVIVGNNDHTYFAIRDEGTQGALLDSFEVDITGRAKASPTLSSDGMLYLPLRTTWIATNGDGEVPSGQVANLFSSFDLTENAQAVLPPPASQRAFAQNASVRLDWRPVADPTGVFDHYSIYRDTQAFSSVSGMNPAATVVDRLTTNFTDGTAMNGTHYYYAVTTVASGGGEITSIASIGPRTPRDETDLQVAALARTPRFPRYDAQYSWYEITEQSGYGPYGFSAATGLGSGQNAFTQRWPGPGDPVTWTATVRNRGTNPVAGPLDYTWKIDGVPVSTGSVAIALAPDETTTMSLVRTWDGMQHEVEFNIAPGDARAGNNQRRAWTKSVAFLSYIDRTRIEAFREETPNYPMAASDDFVDWLNRHMERFNAMFAEAGSAKRVHFDVLEVLPDDAPDPEVPRIDFAIFPFRYRESEGSSRLSGYYDASEDLDYGLLHEMGHQLGMIDLYRLNIGPNQNLVSGSGYSGPECLMNGCSHVLSEHSARAMDHWQDVAHGYYGQYLYCLPASMRLRLLGQDGLPLVGATVRLYQKCERPGIGEVITDQVKASGVTDGHGLFVLPNVPIDTTLVPTTFAGDRLRPNPFGYVAVVGTNAVLLCEVEHAGFIDYCWLDITEANKAFWRGETEVATFERRVSLGGPVEGEPPLDMAELNADEWTAWAQHGTITLSDDTQRMQVGQGSVRIHATGGFDNYARYPGDHLALWNLTQVHALQIWFYAENPNFGGFQERSPWFRLWSRYGYIDLKPSRDVLNDAIGNWVEFAVPLAGDATWERIEHGTPDLGSIQGLDMHIDTWGAGFDVWIDGVHFDPQPPSGAPGVGVEVPTTLALSSATPNPVRGVTALRLDLPARSKVVAAVYDIGGRRVSSIVDGILPAGTHPLVWNCRDASGRTVPAGVYLVRVHAVGREFKRKVVVR